MVECAHITLAAKPRDPAAGAVAAHALDSLRKLNSRDHKLPRTLIKLLDISLWSRMSSTTAVSHVSATLASLRLASTSARVQSFRQSSFVRSAALKQRLGARVAAGSRVSAWFKFGKNGLDAESSGIYGSQGRDDFDRDDVEHYYNYMGMLAVEGTYDKMEKLLNTGIHPVDLLLMMAASEGDKPKIQELLRAGANANVKDMDGRTALDRAADDEIRQLIADGAKQVA